MSIFTYGITSEGDLIPIDDESLIEAARQNGVVPLMVLAAMDAEGNFDSQIASDMLNNPEARERLIENILNTIRAKNLGGVDIDFEFLYAEWEHMHPVDKLDRIKPRRLYSSCSTCSQNI